MTDKDSSFHRQMAIAQRSRPRESSHWQGAGGDIIGDYQVDSELGRGRLSIVWAAVRGCCEGGSVAIKVYREDNMRFYSNETMIFNRIYRYYAALDVWPPHVIEYLGTFAHVCITPDLRPHIYPCLVFKNGGDSLNTLIKFCKAKHDCGIPLPVVKKIMSQLLKGLSYVHNCGVIHTDIKPSNILLNTKIDLFSCADFCISIADFGSSSTDEIFSRNVGTTEYIAPELLIDLPFGTPADVWSACATCFELITGDYLFDVYDECMVTYGDDVDGEATDGLSNSADTDTSDSSGHEANIDAEKIIYRHLLLMTKLLGYPSKEFTEAGRAHYNIRGRLRNNPEIEPICITNFLMSNYQMTRDDCQEIERFLLRGLKYNANERADAHGLMQDQWLTSS
jgi:serine/threonine protein kinase